MKPILLILGLSLFATAAWAGAEKIEFPADYKSRYTLYGTVDRPDLKAKRFLYVNPEVWAAAQAGKPLPDGAILVMEQRKAKLGPDGQPARDGEGRFIATDEISGVFIQEKRKGWGAEYPETTRNGEWEYAVFEGDGARRQANTQPCFTCHKPRVNDDYTFVFTYVLSDIKKKR